jgi:predicted membrane-bound mannosyltransferase
MDFEKILGDSFAYTKEAIVGKWMQWLLLVIATILLCLPLLGYILKIYRGEKPAGIVQMQGYWYGLPLRGNRSKCAGSG